MTTQELTTTALYYKVGITSAFCLEKILSRFLWEADIDDIDWSNSKQYFHAFTLTNLGPAISYKLYESLVHQQMRLKIKLLRTSHRCSLVNR